MKNCPKCGYRLPDNHEVCPFDGAELIGDQKKVGRVNWNQRQQIQENAPPTSLTSARMRRTEHTSIWRKQLQVPLAVIAIVLIGLIAWGATLLTNSSPAAKKEPASLEEMAKGSNLPEAISILERRKKNGTMIEKEHELLNELYLKQASKLKDAGNKSRALELLKKVSPQSAVYPQSAKLTAELEKQHGKQ